MDDNTRKSNPPKRLPSSLIERNLKTTNLLLKIGLQTSGDIISDLFMGKSVNLNKSLFSTKNVYSTVETLKQLRGAAMKFGQLISIDDQLIFTPELSQIIGQLRSSGYSMPPRQVKKVLDKNWGTGWLKNFDSFEVQPFAAASIGQVHKAKLKNGLELAIKIQFPNIRETIKNDMRSLKFIANKASFLPQDFDLNYYLKDDLLTKVDRASMQFSLETRVPILDHRVVEFALNLSPKLKMQGKDTKILLKEVLYEMVPRELFERPKWGFSIPLVKWLKGDLKYLVDEFSSDEMTQKHQIFNLEMIQNLKRKFFAGQDHLYNRIWLVVVLHKWLETNYISR